MKKFKGKLAAYGAFISAMVAATAAQAALPADVSSEIDALVSDIVGIGGLVMTAVITVAGTFALIKWVRRGIRSV